MELTWKKRYDRMKLIKHWTDADVAKITGHNPASIPIVLNRKGSFPHWLRLAIHIFEESNPLTILI